MRNRRLITSLICGLTILVVGCQFTGEGELNPSAPSGVDITPVLLGTWTSVSSVTTGSSTAPSATSCTDLEFTFTEQNGNFYAGTFTATFADGVELIGTASGTYVDGVMTVTGAARPRCRGWRSAVHVERDSTGDGQPDRDRLLPQQLSGVGDGSEVLGRT